MRREDTVFRALADPSRRAIFERLTRGEAAVKDLTARFDISQPAVSQHLATLRGAGLVSERRDGRLVYYRVEPNGLRPLIDWIAHYQAFWPGRIYRLKVLLEEMSN
ncbi:MAG: winged helix-turn-helix transcriptional regulator [Chloroflexi bacterium]|nr:winged helix-turn-helix transcriptional regulator [Chloroflexota bacterium]